MTWDGEEKRFAKLCGNCQSYRLTYANAGICKHSAPRETDAQGRAKWPEVSRDESYCGDYKREQRTCN